MHVNHLVSAAYVLTCNDSLWQTALSGSIFRSVATRSTLLAAFFERLQRLRHRSPQFRPVCEVLPAPPFAVAAQHRPFGDGAAAVVALAHEAAELRVDGDEVVASVHRQEMRRAVRADARKLAIAGEELLGGLTRIGDGAEVDRAVDDARREGVDRLRAISEATLLLELRGGEARHVGRLRERRGARLRAAAALLDEQ